MVEQLGSYKIYQKESDISISNSNNAISNQFIIGNNNDNIYLDNIIKSTYKLV